MNILCITCMHNRPQVSEIFLVGMERLGIPVLACVSDSASEFVCMKYPKTRFFKYKNNPVGDKWNVLLSMAKTIPDWTHLMISGDDDVYTNDIIELYELYIEKPMVGFRNLYFIEPSTRRAVSFEYEKDIPKTIGAGRLMTRAVVEQITANEQIWDGRVDNHLDYAFDMRLLKYGYEQIPIDSGIHVIDIKSEQNIWKFDKFADNQVEDFDKVISVLSEKEIKLINGL